MLYVLNTRTVNLMHYKTLENAHFKNSRFVVLLPNW